MNRELVTAALDFVADSLRVERFAPMLVLFDHGTPKGLARALSTHTVHTPKLTAGRR